jgi:hypothetical protein
MSLLKNRLPDGERFSSGRLPATGEVKEVNYMAKYLVQAAMPTVYVIDARDAQDAMHQAAERFKTEHHTWLEPELQWTVLKGADTAPEWVIEGW